MTNWQVQTALISVESPCCAVQMAVASEHALKVAADWQCGVPVLIVQVPAGPVAAFCIQVWLPGSVQVFGTLAEMYSSVGQLNKGKPSKAPVSVMHLLFDLLYGVFDPFSLHLLLPLQSSLFTSQRDKRLLERITVVCGSDLLCG